MRSGEAQHFGRVAALGRVELRARDALPLQQLEVRDLALLEQFERSGENAASDFVCCESFVCFVVLGTLRLLRGLGGERCIGVRKFGQESVLLVFGIVRLTE